VPPAVPAAAQPAPTFRPPALTRRETYSHQCFSKMPYIHVI
jgi:hypothetical protein